MRWWALAVLLCACASSPPAMDEGASYSAAVAWVDAAGERECGDASEDQCLAPACTEAFCALYRCEDLVPGQMVPTRGSLPTRPPSNSQRYWGNAQQAPGHAEPVLVFHWYRPEELPSQQQARRILEAWRKRPKERHHIFPQAFKDYFAGRGINIHEWVLVIDAQEHERIHRGPKGGPWNADWSAWILSTDYRATKAEHFEQASRMIQRYNLWGLPTTYWQRFELPPPSPQG